MYDITDKKEVVKEIKLYLRTVAEGMYPEIGINTIDGFYDTQTADSVKKYQIIKKLPATGSVDMKTFDTLYLDYKKTTDKADIRGYLVESSGFPIMPEDISEDVRALHILINELGKSYPDMEYVGTGNYYSQRTSKAISYLKEVFLLPSGAGVDVLMYNRMIAELDSQKRIEETADLKAGFGV